MKKILYRIISFAFLIIIGVFLLNVKVYATSNIISVTASGNTQGATISGTTDNDVVAVLIEIMDESNSIITLETHAVTSGSYNATLSSTLTAGKTYTAYVVNYNGTGNPKRTSFNVTLPSGGNNVENNGNSNYNDITSNDENNSNNSNTSNNQTKADANQVDTSSPKTGDENNLLLWLLLLIGFSAAFTGMGIMNIRKIRD